MDWGALSSTVFRATGEATDVTISAAGVATTYSDCKVLTASELARLQRGGSLADVDGISHAISIPKLSGATEPARKATVTAPASAKGSVLRVAGEAGYWVVGVGL